MNKRITSLLLCFVMVVSLLTPAVPVYATGGNTTSATLTSDKTKAYTGDTITYTVTLGPVTKLKALAFALQIPDGLTFVENSGKVADGLAAKMSASAAMFAPTSMFVSVADANYTSSESVVLMTFQCTVDKGTSGSITAGIGYADDDADNSIFDTSYNGIAVTFTGAAVTIADRPETATTAVSLNTDTLSLVEGNTGKLTATVTPAGSSTVTWSSSNTKVATVDANGTVTAVKKGTAAIVATVGARKASCKVTVSCNHAFESVEGKASTCIKKGWNAYQKCSRCGAMKNTAGETITEIPYHTAFAAHDYSKETAITKYKATNATCEENATYYKSCSVCGAKGTETFVKIGSKLGHSKAKTYTPGKTEHWYACTVCNEKVDPKEHNYNQKDFSDTYKATDATCTEKATYYYSCICGAKGTETFTHGNPLGHTEGDTYDCDATSHWKVCTVSGCGFALEVTKEAHTLTDNKCSVCQYVVKAQQSSDDSSPSSSGKTETTENADGSTTTTVTNADGETTVKAEASVSVEAVEAAQKENKAVIVPVEVKATTDTESAPVVSVSIPKSAGEVKVEIPVTNVSSGTVAVLVNADGTEEILKTTIPTENGVDVKVSGDVTIKLVDNSKSFTDTIHHWSTDEVNFVAARNLFNGVGDHLFGVSAPMTRGMVNTVLARLSGADTEGGAHWYDKGTDWAVANGISDGTNPTGNVTREQLATMLYRFAGSPEVSGTLSFTDAASVSSYAQNAMLWASQVGILSGFGDGSVAPTAGAERAQVAAMLARYIKLVG